MTSGPDVTPNTAERSSGGSARWNPVRWWAQLVAASIPAVFGIGLLLGFAGVTGTEHFDVLGAAFVYAIIGTAVACALVAVSAGDVPRSRGYIVAASMMGVLAGLAPISAILFIRLSSRACVVLNVLGLPWPEPWREAAHLGGGLIWSASTVFLLVALAAPRLRRAATAMWIWSGIITIPAGVLFMLIVGDVPATGCTPV
ncbi:hypothetical protein GCM10009819_08500 [Agromyces tropicus]|uniref:DUF998 domain-containing protein n=1 Tax=Agromyces tropicus TaxID=555371 RepID=A0ABP5FII8_9MICO